MTQPPGASEPVDGERAGIAPEGGLTFQSRINNGLALGLMLALGLGSLGWYYAHALKRPSREREAEKSAAAARAQNDAPLPALGRIDPPLRTPALPETGSQTPAELNEASFVPVDRTLTEVPVAQSAAGGGSTKTAAELELERKMSGAVFAAQSASASAAIGEANAAGSSGAAIAAQRQPADVTRVTASRGELSTLLQANVETPVRAQVLPAQRLLLPRGAFIDCTLETAIDSTLPGMTTCITATDTFGVDGNVVLLERGTKMIGETRGQVQQGAARIFVLWTEARTPSGVVVPLDSPGADELGRSGLPGEVNRHFWQRFGAAILVSVIDASVQGALQSSRNTSGAVVVNPSASQEMLTDVLKGTIDIPPTVVKHNGDRIQVLVARDLDFRSVYELRSTAR